jgi:hypothetical protein
MKEMEMAYPLLLIPQGVCHGKKNAFVTQANNSPQDEGDIGTGDEARLPTRKAPVREDLRRRMHLVIH